MQWTPEQENALMGVSDWMKDPSRQVLKLFGYAGTGKTTLAKHFAEGVGGQVLFGAYTGKAASVLKAKGCEGARTIHSMIYNPKEKGLSKLKELEQSLMELIGELREAGQNPEEHRRVKDIKELIEKERVSLSKPTFSLNEETSVVRLAKLVIIDECSMIDGKMGEDLLSFGVKILVLGDPAQLPPVKGSGFFTDGKPDIMLTEIRRQARDNPIIDLATRVRNKEEIPLGVYGNSAVLTKDQINPEDALSADQILVGRNKTRFGSNERMRFLLGRQKGVPIAGDKLVCLRNNHDKGLLNGTLWQIEDIGEKSSDRIYMTVRPEEGGDSVEVECHMSYFNGSAETMTWWEKKEAEEFDYGYAITVHKAQGSQWNNVMLIDESQVFREDRWKWLYTGITRAAESIKIVR